VYNGSGSGFLVHVEGKNGYVITNAHVVKTKANIIFNSGENDEKSYYGSVISWDEDRDLALIKITGTGFPAPLDYTGNPMVNLTMPVYIFGFPFGEGLNISREGNPAITVSKGSISSIRKDEYNNVSYIQVTGSINPGNSGGPIVDKEGKLIGIVVIKRKGTQIAFAIPTNQLKKFFNGRIRTIRPVEKYNEDGIAEIIFRAITIDPLNKISKIGIAIGPKKNVKTPYPINSSGYPGRIFPLKDYRELKWEKRSTAAIKRLFHGKPGETKEFVFQVYFIDGSGKIQFLNPTVQKVKFKGQEMKPEQRKPSKTIGDDDWLGKKNKASVGGKLTVKSPGKSILGILKTVKDAKVHKIDLPAELIVGDLLWENEKGNSFYSLNSKGVIYQVSVPGFKILKEINLEYYHVSDMALSQEGIVVVFPRNHEVMIIGPVKLTYKAILSVPGAHYAAASLKSRFVFITMSRYTSDSSKVVMIDAKEKRIVNNLNGYRMGEPQKSYSNRTGIITFNYPTVSPDGNYFFCESSESLHRFKITNSSLIYEEAGPPIADGPQRIVISPDSKYICLLSGSVKRHRFRGHPDIGNYGTYVYRIDDISTPIVSFESGSFPRALGFDKKARMIYAQNHKHQLITFSPDGKRMKEYQLTFGGDTVNHFLVHPSGKKLLILTKKSLLWVTL
jgi:hypothetical protein